MASCKLATFFLVSMASLPLLALAADCDCAAAEEGSDKAKALALKIIAIFCIVVASAVGCAIPSLGRRFPALRPDTDLFFAVKAFAAGVILATAFVHILPDAFEQLGSPCLVEGPWRKFPFAGLVAMLAAIATMVIDTLATGYFQRAHARLPAAVGDAATAPCTDDLEASDAHGMHGHGHGHAHGVSSMIASSATQNADGDDAAQLIRHRVISQVLELGIVVHSVIIGMSVGASDSPSTIRPLVAALTFHQFFEGIGLGGCIAQAKFHLRSTVTMAAFFSLTTPVGIVIGIGISSVYDENSPKALIVEGLLDAAAAGILTYMALVDLLAEDFMSSRVQKNGRLQLVLNISLLLGTALMALLAIWA